MKRKALTLSLTLALSFLAAEAMLVNFSIADPTPVSQFPTKPVMTPPTIVVHSPLQNQSYSLNDLWLNFTIVKPEAWILLLSGGHDPSGNPFYGILVNVIKVYYVMDDGERQYVPVHDISYNIYAFPNRTLNFSTNLVLTEGVHSVKVGFEAQSYYRDDPNALDLSSVPLNGNSEAVNFTVVKPPIVDVISPANQTYNATTASLVFTVNKPALWMGYSLDGQGNVTVTGNSTLADLSDGLHNVTAYANDTFGIMGKSETIAFTVAKPEPFPTSFVIAASGASIAVACVGLAVYFKKKGRDQNK